jgi:hypothetical protein
VLDDDGAALGQFEHTKKTLHVCLCFTDAAWKPAHASASPLRESAKKKNNGYKKMEMVNEQRCRRSSGFETHEILSAISSVMR